MEVGRSSVMVDTQPASYTHMHSYPQPHSLGDSHDAFMDAGAKSFFYDEDGLDGDDDDRVSDMQFTRPSRVAHAHGGDMRMSSIAKLPTMHLRGAAFHGWLWKKGASFKTWKQRFFLLNGSTLTYYTQSCVVATELGVRCLEMPPKGGLRVAAAEFTDMTQFGIRITSSSGRVLYVQAGDRGARIKWLGVLQEAAKKKCRDAAGSRATTTGTTNTTSRSSSGCKSMRTSGHQSMDEASLPSSSLSSTLSSETDEQINTATDMAGWLFVRRRGSSFVTLFKKRYFTLVDGHLTITRSPGARGKTIHEVISATVWDGRENGLRLQLGNHKELVAYTSGSDEQKRWLQVLHNNL